MKDELTTTKVVLILLGLLPLAIMEIIVSFWPKKKEIKLEQVLLANAFLHEDKSKITWK